MSEEHNEGMFCYNHPKRVTHLRCNKCERPICISCAVLTPTGYRCKECVRGQQKIFDTAMWWDYPLAAILAFILSMIGSLIITFVGFFTIFLAPFAGIGIAEAVRFVIRRRRSRNIPMIVALATFLGGILLHLSSFLVVFSGISQTGLYSLLTILWPILYAILASSSAFYRLKGIQL